MVLQVETEIQTVRRFLITGKLGIWEVKAHTHTEQDTTGNIILLAALVAVQQLVLTEETVELANTAMEVVAVTVLLEQPVKMQQVMVKAETEDTAVVEPV